DEIEKRRLAGAVGADDQPPLAFRYRQVHRAGDTQAAERLVQVMQCQRGHPPPSWRTAGTGAARALRDGIAQRHSRAQPGTSPSGMNTTISTKMAPRTKFQRSI